MVKKNLVFLFKSKVLIVYSICFIVVLSVYFMIVKFLSSSGLKIEAESSFIKVVELRSILASYSIIFLLVLVIPILSLLVTISNLKLLLLSYSERMELYALKERAKLIVGITFSNLIYIFIILFLSFLSLGITINLLYLKYDLITINFTILKMFAIVVFCLVFLIYPIINSIFYLVYKKNYIYVILAIIGIIFLLTATLAAAKPVKNDFSTTFSIQNSFNEPEELDVGYLELVYMSDLENNQFYQKHLLNRLPGEDILVKYYDLLNQMCSSKQTYIVQQENPVFLCKKTSTELLNNVNYQLLKAEISKIEFSTNVVDFFRNILTMSETAVQNWLIATLKTDYVTENSSYNETFFEQVKISEDGLFVPFYLEKDYQDALNIFENNLINAFFVSVYQNPTSLFLDNKTKNIDNLELLLNTGSLNFVNLKKRLFINLNWNFDYLRADLITDFNTIGIDSDNLEYLFDTFLKFSLYKDLIFFNAEKNGQLEKLNDYVNNLERNQILLFLNHASLLFEQDTLTTQDIYININSIANLKNTNLISSIPTFRIGIEQKNDLYVLTYQGERYLDFNYLYLAYVLFGIGFYCLFFLLKNRFLIRKIKTDSIELFFEEHWKGNKKWKKF